MMQIYLFLLRLYLRKSEQYCFIIQGSGPEISASESTPQAMAFDPYSTLAECCDEELEGQVVALASSSQSSDSGLPSDSVLLIIPIAVAFQSTVVLNDF